MDDMQPINTVHINEQVYEAIEGAIVRSELGPGALLGDRQLAEALGVSRTPVRDALHRLESSGLVERRGRAGWAVSGFALRDVHELFELRRILEPSRVRATLPKLGRGDDRGAIPLFRRLPRADA
jgi:DNA-binding GntR family transcriptional regulator